MIILSTRQGENMIKKPISVLIAIVLTLGTISLSSAQEENTGPTITVGEVAGVQGETVDVPVFISNNSGIVAFYVNVRYDNTNHE
ncbi:MAG: hypothetical protein FWH20_11540 [Oscillospiraceae bacterium]|nr:hypothetical protein [Oscillospiraceae bacterium]